MMEQKLHIRRRRIIEATTLGAIPPGIKDTHLILAKKLKLENDVERKESTKTNYTQIAAINEMKLKVLENWESTKRKAIERLAQEIEELQQIEEKIEERECELAERGIRINEEIFRSYCNKTPDMTKTLLTTSTPKILDLKKRPKVQVQPTKLLLPVDKKLKLFCEESAAVPSEEANDMISIGPNGTMVSKKALHAINWSLSGAAVTRKILMEVFDRKTLAFHTLTGKPSPAFVDCIKPLKHQLDPAKVADIIHIVTQNLKMSAKEVRNAITTKCADENKMFRQRERKRLSMQQKSG